MCLKEVVLDTELEYSGRYHLLEDLCHGSGGTVFDRDPARRDLLTTLAIEHDGPFPLKGIESLRLEVRVVSWLGHRRCENTEDSTIHLSLPGCILTRLPPNRCIS